MTRVKKKKSGGLSSSSIQLRPPIVVVLGHVDHGKTTLLDKIRKSRVAEKEVGGITQGIGASVVTNNQGRRITFIDTPGHAAFANMRSRGAKVADIAVLVVAADDGVKPQTREALEYILEAKIPFIVVVSKIDLPNVSIDSVKDQLGDEQVVLEDKGGEVPMVSVSGKTGEGIEDLLEMIILVSELQGVEVDERADLEAVVIETGKSKTGSVVSLVVRQGVLSVKDEVVADNVAAKVRGLIDFQGKRVKEVGPGEPVQVLGFSDLPAVGSQVWKRKGEAVKPAGGEERLAKKGIQEGELSIVLKAKSSGALEAVLANIDEKVVVVDSGVGDVNESDVFMAKSADAYIFAFESKVSRQVKKLAQAEGVDIRIFEVIYELFEELEKLLKEDKVIGLGKAEIIQTFPFNKKRVAGCRVVEGRISRNDKALLVRGEKEIGKVRIVSMKKGKLSVSVAKTGEECGILFAPQLEFEIGDMVISVRK